MEIGEIKSLLQQIQSLLKTLHPKDQKSYLYENYDDGTTVTWRFKNCASPQTVEGNVKSAAIWLWSLKDYLKSRITATGGRAQDVEDYVNRKKHLCVLADVANTAKHGRLRSSRTGRFIRVCFCNFTINGSSRVSTVLDGDANVEFSVEDPDKVSYRVSMNDRNGCYAGDALRMLEQAQKDWLSFIRRRPELRDVLKS